MFFKKKYTDKELIHGLLTHDDPVYRYIDKTFRSSVNSIVLNNSGITQDAEDHYINVVMKVCENLKNKKYCTNKGSFKGYFVTVARGMWIDKLRKRKKEITYSVLEEWHTNSLRYSMEMEEESISEKLSVLLLKCMKELSEKEQEMIKQRYHQNLSFKEVTTNLGYTNHNSARVKMDRIKQKLRKMIQESADQEVQTFLKSVKS